MLARTRVFRSPGAAALAAIALLAAAPPAVSARTDHRYRHRGPAAQACPGAGTAVASASRRAVRQAVLCLVNQERAAHGLPRLRASAALTRSAQGWTDDMLASGTFSHGSDFASRIAGVGYQWSAVGENIALGFPTAGAVVQAWMGDVGHCQNILNPGYRDLGVGIKGQGGSGAAFWTQDFGRRAAQSPRSSNWGPADGCPYPA